MQRYPVERSLCRHVLQGWLLLIPTCCAGTATHEPAAPEGRATAVSKQGDRDRGPAEAACSPKLRKGTYRVQYRAFSTTCPDLADQTETMQSGAPALSKDCSLQRPDHWSKDGCTLERVVICQAEDGTSTRTVLSSKQKQPDASVLTGMISVERKAADESSLCQGTYSFQASREAP